MYILFHVSFIWRHVYAFAINSMIGSVFEPGASRLPYYYTPPVTAPDVIGARAVWQQIKRTKVNEHMTIIARKYWRVLALRSPLPLRTYCCTVCKTWLSCDTRSPDSGGPLARLASKSRHHDSSPKAHIHECGLRRSSHVSRPSSCYSSTDCHMDILSVYASADQSSQAYTDWADSSSQDNKLSTQACNTSSVVSWVSLEPIPNLFLLQKASLVRIRSWINYTW